MKLDRTALQIDATAARIISGVIIAVGISMLITNTAMTTPFIMGIALSILGTAIVVLVQRHPVILVTKKPNS